MTETIEVSTLDKKHPVCECDTFQFMAQKVGLRVLHPGGLRATVALAETCQLASDMTVLDVGCGAGSTAIFLARKYGCRVIGIDVDRGLLMKAQNAVSNARIGNRVAFRLGDVHNLPFQDAVFSGAISQAVLIFTDKARAVGEIVRKIRPRGFLGLIELTWKREPPADVLNKVKSTLCDVVSNAETITGWEGLLQESGLRLVYSEVRDVNFSFKAMVHDEGLLGSMRVALKTVTSSSIRRKTREIATLFKEVHDYLGYGTYVAVKD